jgi:hypothetical protein
LEQLEGARIAVDGCRRREAAWPVGDRYAGMGKAGEGKGNRRRAPLPPRESSRALGHQRGAARRRRGKLLSRAAMAAAAWVLGF